MTCFLFRKTPKQRQKQPVLARQDDLTAVPTNDTQSETRSQGLKIERDTDMNQSMSLIPQQLVLKRGLLRNSNGQIGELFHKGQFRNEDRQRAFIQAWRKMVMA